MGAVMEVNDNNFDAEVLNAKGKVLVDFLGAVVRPLQNAGSDT